MEIQGNLNLDPLSITRIDFAHTRIPVLGNEDVEIAVFRAGSDEDDDKNRSDILNYLTERARRELKLKIDLSALVYEKNRVNQYYGDKNLVAFLVKSGVPRMTHFLNT